MTDMMQETIKPPCEADIDSLFSEVVDAREFMRIMLEAPETIEGVEMIFPKPGETGQAKMKVTRTFPVYRIPDFGRRRLRVGSRRVYGRKTQRD
jgi:hypothetical protein